MRLDRKYILNENGNPVVEPDLMKWGQWLQNNKERIVKQENIGPYFVSTVFLGLDHNWSNGPPILWETLVFGKGPLKDEMTRCGGTREQAEAMHEAMVKRVKEES